MCCIFKIVYACGHRDVIKAPCEWRDEGRINILGERVPCENSTRNLADLTQICMTCSPDPIGHDLVDREDMGGSYIACDEKDVIARIVKNEAHLRIRAKISRIVPTPPVSLGFPSSSELQYRFCMNEEFLTRRLKRRYFQAHLDGRGEYQVFLETSQAHLDARAELNSSIFTIETSVPAGTPTRNGQEAPAQTMRIQTADASTQTDEIEDVIAWSDSDDYSITIRPINPHNGRQVNHLPLRPRAPSPPSPPQLDASTCWVTGSQPQNPVDEAREFIISREYGGESSSSIVSASGEAREQQHLNQDQIAEVSDFVNDFSDEAETGRSRPDSSQAKIPLDSPEGIAALADIRSFLGMRPYTKPLDIWNFASRNSDLVGFINDNTLPIRQRKTGPAKRLGFDRDPGLDTVLDYADDKWELRTGFVETWNSLHWSFEALSGPLSDTPGPSSDENNGLTSDSAIDELYRAPIVANLVSESINIYGPNYQNAAGQKDDHKQESEAKEEEKTYPFEGRRAKLLEEVDFVGKPRTPKHQAKKASRLRISWTSADQGNPVSSRKSEDEALSALSSPSTSPTLRGDTASPISSPPSLPTSLNEPISPFISALLSSLDSSHADSIPHLSLGKSSIPFEPEDIPQRPALQEERDSPDTADNDSSDGSISARVFERKVPPILYDSDSTVGKRMLDFLRRFFAMPNSRTPQEISKFIDLHPGLMKAVREGYVPTCKPTSTLSKRKLRQQPTEANLNPMYLLRARRDRKHRLMQANLATALKVLDWDAIDDSPIPFMPSSPWDSYNHRTDRGRNKPHDDDDEEEECDFWVRTTVGLRPERLSNYDDRYLMKYQVKTHSPLRTMLTRRETEEEVADTRSEEEEKVHRIQADLGQGSPPGQKHREEDSSDTLEPEIWDDVNLNISDA